MKQGQTIEYLTKPDSESELLKNKNFADIRVNKLHKKKIPDAYGKSINTARA